MNEYRKLIAAVVGLVVMFGQRYGLDLSAQEAALVDIIIAILTAASVWWFKNERTA